MGLVLCHFEINPYPNKSLLLQPPTLIHRLFGPLNDAKLPVQIQHLADIAFGIFADVGDEFIFFGYEYRSGEGVTQQEIALFFYIEQFLKNQGKLFLLVDGINCPLEVLAEVGEFRLKFF